MPSSVFDVRTSRTWTGMDWVTCGVRWMVSFGCFAVRRRRPGGRLGEFDPAGSSDFGLTPPSIRGWILMVMGSAIR